jgi:hypothetical protein
MAAEHEDDDDPQLKSLRQVWLSMRDEDPPSSGLDALMAAARSQVEVPAKPPLWQRIVSALRRPPMLALATVMILIGGAVIFTRHRNELEQAPTAPSALPDRSRSETRDVQLHSVPQPPPKLGVPAPTGLPDKPPTKHAVPPPVTRPRHAVAVPATDDGFAAGQDHEAQKDAKAAPNTVLVEQLATQARSAVTRGDCETARSIGARIARQDASYYREHVAGDLSACTSTTTIDAR